MADPNAFTGAGLDRGSDRERQDPAWVREQYADPRARALVAGSAGIQMSDGRLALTALHELPDAESALLLGRDDEGPVFAYDEEPPPSEPAVPPLVGAGGRRGEPPAATSGQRVALREAAALLPQAEGGLAAYATALLNWHRRHRFCAVCGAPSDVDWGGLVRLCPRCGASHHPRTDPVVIMLVSDGADRALLGRQPSWPTGRYSALAGFVAPGESLEEAVAREVWEEARVRIGRPVYMASQPWPFPESLMLGFHAQWLSGDPDPSEEELQDARWFARDEIAAAAGKDSDAGWGTPGEPGGELVLPPRLAIARRLVEDWLAR
ncbi:MAG TPA: NAD(+) diphosphatase [Solirubrobacteraceae bacterium]